MLPSLAGPMPPRKSLRPTPHVRLPPLQAVKLLDQLRERIRYLHYSQRTEEAYVYWVRAFIRWQGRKGPHRDAAAVAARRASCATRARARGNGHDLHARTENGRRREFEIRSS